MAGHSKVDKSRLCKSKVLALIVTILLFAWCELRAVPIILDSK